MRRSATKKISANLKKNLGQNGLRRVLSDTKWMENDPKMLDIRGDLGNLGNLVESQLEKKSRHLIFRRTTLGPASHQSRASTWPSGLLRTSLVPRLGRLRNIRCLGNEWIKMDREEINPITTGIERIKMDRKVTKHIQTAMHREDYKD